MMTKKKKKLSPVAEQFRLLGMPGHVGNDAIIIVIGDPAFAVNLFARCMEANLARGKLNVNYQEMSSPNSPIVRGRNKGSALIIACTRIKEMQRLSTQNHYSADAIFRVSSDDFCTKSINVQQTKNRYASNGPPYVQLTQVLQLDIKMMFDYLEDSDS